MQVSARSDVFVTPGELQDLMASRHPVTVLDVRWSLAEPNGESAYRRGHLPGAVYVSLDDELSDHRVAGRGRHPLPSGSAVQTAARRWGLRTGVPTVVYDDWNRAGSARAWWVLTAAGLDDVRILDGGLAAWSAAGGALQSGPVTAEPGNVVVAHEDLYRGARRTVTADQVLTGVDVLLDARAPERFRGEVEPVDPVAGHIPGAVNLPSTDLLSGDGTLLPDADLRAALAGRGAVGGTDVAAYCGSGVTASLAVAGLAAAGVDAALYPGSWSEWGADAAHPVARGDR